MDTFNRYKRLSESLDIKTTLCNKEWWVFNDTGEKAIYIFQENEELFISVNGIVTIANWKLLSTNNCLMIKTTNGAVLLRPVFQDSIILSLQLDGTDTYAFLIDDANKRDFLPKTLNDIKNYFHNKSKISENRDITQKKLEYEQESRAQSIIDKQTKEKLAKELELKRQKDFEEKVNSILLKDQYLLTLSNKHDKLKSIKKKTVVFLILAHIPFIILILSAIIRNTDDVGDSNIDKILMMPIAIMWMVFLAFYKLEERALVKYFEYEERAKKEIISSLGYSN
jgi:hypothetical protein